MAKDNLIKIGGELKSVAADGVVAGAEAIYDYSESKSQATINQDLKQAIEDIDVTDQISGKADKSEMSVVAGTGANADKTTITLKSGTSATVLTQHQDISGKANSADVYTKAQMDDMFDDVAHWGDTVGNVTTADFNAQTDTVWNKTQVLSAAQQAQARTNIGAGTVNSVTVNGTTYSPTNGDVNLGTIGGGGGSGEANVIESISINGNAQTITSKNVDLAVPTSSTITAIVTLTEAQYTALATKDSSTLYIITA